MLSKLSILFMILFLGGIHLGAVVALIYFFDIYFLFITILLWQFFALIGISVCFHREITHRSFKSVYPIRLFHLTCALIAGQAGPIMWAQVHRIHHKYSDKEGDPHSPINGLWKAHFGWIFEQGKRKSLKDFQVIPKDLAEDRTLKFFQVIHFPFFISLFVLLFILGGWKWMLWFGCVRVALTLNSSWMINSLGHYWGYQNYEGIDLSRNNKLIAFFTGGEGFHNNHHKRPRSSNLAHFKGEFDLGFQYIRLLRKLNLITKLIE